MNTIKYPYILSLICAIGIIACESPSAPTARATAVVDNDDRIFLSQAQWDANQYEWTQVTEKSIPKTVLASGKIGVPPQHKAQLSVPVRGVIQTILIKEGDRVRSGELVARIHNPEIINEQREYAELSQELKFLQKEYDRKKQLAEEKLIPQKDFWALENKWKTTQTRVNSIAAYLKSLNINLVTASEGKLQSYVPIYSPLSGTVSHVDIVQGSAVATSSILATIIDESAVQLELEVFEKDIIYIKNKQKIDFTIPELRGAPQKAQVSRKGVTLSENRKVMVYGDIDQTKQKLLDGMFVNAKIEIDSVLSPTLPATSVVDKEDEYWALAMDEKTPEGYYLRPVRLEVVELVGDDYQLVSVPETQNQYLKVGAFQLME